MTRTKRLALLWMVLGIWGALAAAEAQAKMYRYQDRDGNVVVVDDPGKIPPEYREATKEIEPGSLPSGENLPPPPPPDAYSRMAEQIRAAVNDAFVKAGRSPVTSEEATRLVGIFKKWGPLVALGMLVQLLAWILLVVHGFRNDHPVWAVLTLVLTLPGALYAAIHVEEPPKKILAILGIVGPLVLFGTAAYQIFSWLTAAALARGGSM